MRGGGAGRGRLGWASLLDTVCCQRYILQGLEAQGPGVILAFGSDRRRRSRKARRNNDKSCKSARRLRLARTAVARYVTRNKIEIGYFDTHDTCLTESRYVVLPRDAVRLGGVSPGRPPAHGTPQRSGIASQLHCTSR